MTPSVNANVGNEAVATAVPVFGGRAVVVSYNSNFGAPLPDGYITHCGWAKSNTSQSSFQSYDSYYTPLPIPTTSSGAPFGRCRGDTWVATVGPQAPLVVVMSAVIQAQDGNGDVVLYTSTNAGTSWTNVARLSEGVSAGTVDGSKVAVDPTNRAAYVWWWANNAHYLRKAVIGANGSITLSPVKTLTGLVPGGAPLHASLTIKPATSTTSLPRVFLAYPTAGMLVANCTSPNGLTDNVTWYLAYSDNDGSTWTSHQVDNDPAWPSCQFPSPALEPNLGDNQSYISSAYDPVSDRVLLAYQKHVEDVNLQYVRTRIITAQWPQDPGGTGFDAWTPVCNPAVCPPPGNCLVNGRLPAGETYCTQFGQSIGVRPVGVSSRMAVVWHDTRDTNPVTYPHPAVGDATTRNKVQSNIWGHSIRPGEPYDCPPFNDCPKTQSRLTALAGNVPWLPTANNGNVWYGDYEQGVVDVGGRFFSVWGDNRDQSPTTRLKGARFNEGEAP